MNENSLNKKLTRIDTAIAGIRTAVEKDNIEIEELSTEVDKLKAADPYKYFYYGTNAPDPAQYKYWLPIDTTKEAAPVKMIYNCTLNHKLVNISNGTGKLICRKPTRDINMNATSSNYHLTKNYAVIDNALDTGEIFATTGFTVYPREKEEDGELFFNNKYIRGEGESKTYVLSELLTDLYLDGENKRFFIGTTEKYNNDLLYVFYPTSATTFKYVSINLANDMVVTDLGSTTECSWIKYNGYVFETRGLVHIDSSTFLAQLWPTSGNSNTTWSEFTISNKVITKTSSVPNIVSAAKSQTSTYNRFSYINTRVLLWDSIDYSYVRVAPAGYDVTFEEFISARTTSGATLKDLIANAGYKMYSETANSSNTRYFDSADNNNPYRYGVVEIQKSDGSTTARGLLLYKIIYGTATTQSTQRPVSYEIETIIEPSQYNLDGLANGSLYKYIYSYNPRTKTLKFLINNSVTAYTGTTSSTKTVSGGGVEIVLTYDTIGEVSPAWVVESTPVTSIPSENNVIFNTRTSQYKLYISEDAYFCVQYSSNKVPFYYNNIQYNVYFYNNNEWTTIAPTQDRNA